MRRVWNALMSYKNERLGALYDEASHPLILLPETVQRFKGPIDDLIEIILALIDIVKPGTNCHKELVRVADRLRILKNTFTLARLDEHINELNYIERWIDSIEDINLSDDIFRY